MRGMLRAFEVQGLNLERLLQLAGEREMTLYGVRRLGARRVIGCVEEKAVPILRTMAAEGGWELRIGGARGIARCTDWCRRRARLGLMCLAALIAAAYASTMMWRVEVVNAGVYEADVREYLAEQGVHPVMPRDKVELAKLRDALEWRYPRVAWVECAWRGTTLQVTLVEGAQAGQAADWKGSADVVAARDGIVQSVVTLAGTACVKAGQAVRAGDVLIRGRERGDKDEMHPVAARGEVMARVWDTASVSVPLRGVKTTYTGRKSECTQVATPWFSLWAADESPFEHADVERQILPLGGWLIPTQIIRTIRHETEWSPYVRDEAEVRAEAATAALRLMEEKAGFHEDFIDKWVDYSMIESGEVVAVAYGERVMDIARQTLR